MHKASKEEIPFQVSQITHEYQLIETSSLMFEVLVFQPAI
jgi:hypothetical protein